jgi:hypothetical protein
MPVPRGRAHIESGVSGGIGVDIRGTPRLLPEGQSEGVDRTSAEGIAGYPPLDYWYVRNGGEIARAAARLILKIPQITFCRRLPYDMRSSLKEPPAAPKNHQQTRYGEFRTEGRIGSGRKPCVRTKRTHDTRPRETMSFGERIGLLSVKRQELIRPIQEHPRDYALLSIRDVASTLQSDPATILRIVGFQSYRELTAYLHELSIANAMSLEGLKTGSRIDSGLSAQRRQVLERDIQNVQALRHTFGYGSKFKLAVHIRF